MTSAERAKDLVDAIFLSGSQWGEHDWKYAQEIIAEALRRAQNDKLEEAARVAEKAFGGKAHTYASENADIYRAQDAACERIASHIRALKKD